MTRFRLVLVLLSAFSLRPADAGETTRVIAVDSPAFYFSPGTWSGDAGRGGGRCRQTWNPGAYLRVTWETKSAKPAARLRLDTSTQTGSFKPPRLGYCIDGVWRLGVPCTGDVVIAELAGAGRHELAVHLTVSEQKERWGAPGQAAWNVLRVTGLEVDAESAPVPAAPRPAWALLIGDSITEGCGAGELCAYSHLVGAALQARGLEYGLSACGWSGWLHRGDNPPGDVPGYYTVSKSVNGAGGQYSDADSRWNKIDANHSLLDSRGRISAYGQSGQEPSVIMLNYGTNDAIHKTNASDVQASMSQCLPALRKAAPNAHIFIIIPFGQYKAAELKQTVTAYHAAHPDDRRLSIIDLGPGVARALAANGYWGGLHPNPRAHATFAAEIVAQMTAALGNSSATSR